MDVVIPMADLQLVNMPLEQFLEIYANYVNRTILRAAALPNLNVTLQAQTPLTVEEAIQAMDSVLSLNGYTTIPVGEKFVTFVPSANALQEGAAFLTITDAADLPEANQYITHIKQLKHILPSEAVPMLTPMAKNAAGIVALDVSKTLVLRDNSSNIKRMLELLERIGLKCERSGKMAGRHLNAEHRGIQADNDPQPPLVVGRQAFEISVLMATCRAHDLAPCIALPDNLMSLVAIGSSGYV